MVLTLRSGRTLGKSGEAAATGSGCPAPMRQPFTCSDTVAMVAFVQKLPTENPRTMLFWKKAEEQGITSHSHQSMANHFRRKIAPAWDALAALVANQASAPATPSATPSLVNVLLEDRKAIFEQIEADRQVDRQERREMLNQIADESRKSRDAFRTEVKKEVDKQVTAKANKLKDQYDKYNKRLHSMMQKAKQDQEKKTRNMNSRLTELQQQVRKELKERNMGRKAHHVKK